MIPEPKLLLPGPTPVPPQVEQAIMTPMQNHRGPEITALHQRLQERLGQLWGSAGVGLLPASGTGALEALLANALPPGEAVLAVTAGAFGDRFGQIAERLGLQVDWLRLPWGEAVDPERVLQRLRAGRASAVLLTHNETSTGVLNPLKDLARAVSGAVDLVLVDSVSGTPSVPLEMADWGIDGVAAASQKGFMLPPGLGLVALGPGARARFRGRPSLTWDLAPYLDGQWPYTPPVALLHGLAASLDLLDEEGAPARFRRHRLMAQMVREGAQALGFTGLACPDRASPTVTALAPPTGVDPARLRSWCRAHGLELAGGQGPWKSRAVRVGHVGYVGPLDMVGALAVLEMGLAALAGRPITGEGARRALTIWHADGWPNPQQEDGVHG
jgi:alanine-glyoxylate transaminase/serine-glyoxylate transaminase/serine-pyruvate transaminase